MSWKIHLIIWSIGLIAAVALNDTFQWIAMSIATVGYILLLLVYLHHYASRQLRTGGVSCTKCGHVACGGPSNHSDDFVKQEYPSYLKDYILDKATPKCDQCHIGPATKKSVIGERTCNQC